MVQERKTTSTANENRADDKAWIQSEVGQKALSEARTRAETAIRQLQTSPPVLQDLVKRRLVR